jgi:hypothetical protein
MIYIPLQYVGFLHFFKGSRPFQEKKTILGGLTAHLGACLNQVASGVKISNSGMS